ncbi:pPIWI_RE_Y domain-containing protein [Streptomyces aureocirculatus]|uniref:pPIWI_RE_Y domain-containing protein n=1 Tax=Streptomyces aureocirculatus TaxID=67275 RepID=UPI00201DAB3A|nr:hypothetical protein [Streptomyces aureocirculatus]
MIDLLPVRLREWVPLAWDELPSSMGDLVVLTDNGGLTEEAFEAGMNYLEALYGDDGYFDLGGAWLPAWVRQTAEQTERAAFRHIRSGGQAGYVAARTMLTEVPYGTERALVEGSTRGVARHGWMCISLFPRTVCGWGRRRGSGRVRSAGIRWCCGVGSCGVSTRRIRAGSGLFRAVEGGVGRLC